MDDFDKISGFLEAAKDEMVSRLVEFVRIPSVSNDIPEVKRSLRYILSLAERLGFSAEAVLDEQIGIIECGDGPETLGILAHVDVVPADGPDSWSSPPFEPAVHDGAVWGRGTLDDKGAVIASLYALKAVKDLGLPFFKKVRIILGTQEEVEWSDMRDYVKSFPLPDYGFSPDGEFPVCNIEKGIGGVTISFPLRSAEYTADTRENRYTLLSIDAGPTNNIIPPCCAAKLLFHDGEGGEKEIRLTAAGVSAHASIPEKGDNAIVNMCNILKFLPFTDKSSSVVTALIAGELCGPSCESLGLEARSEYYNGEFIHRNSMSPTVIRTEENRLELYMDVRLAYGTAKEEILAGLERLAAPAGGTVIANTLEPATYVDSRLPFMNAFAEAYERACGKKNEFTLAYGGSYAKAMPNIVSWGPVFPWEEDTCHEPDEHIGIESLTLTAKIYGEAIRRIALSEGSFL